MEITNEESAACRPKTVYECMLKHRDMNLLEAINHTYVCISPVVISDLKPLRRAYQTYLERVMRIMTKPDKFCPVLSFCDSRSKAEQRQLAQEVGI